MTFKEIVEAAIASMELRENKQLIEPEVWIEFGLRVKEPISIADRINYKTAYLSQLPEGSIVRSRYNSDGHLVWEYLL